MKEFNGAWDLSIDTDAGYYDEEYDDAPEPICEKCNQLLVGSREIELGVCGVCLGENDEETLDGEE